MNLIDVYHCSPIQIDSFNYEKGVHFGGEQSALRVGLRKLEYEGLDFVFLHHCTLNISNFVNEDDLGSNWYESVENTFDLYKYTNKYEPDIYASWYTCNPTLCSINKVITLSYDNVIKRLDQLEGSYLWRLS